MNPILFNYNSIGKLEIELPQGAKSDSYRLYLLVNIIDDLGGSFVYYLKIPVIVQPNNDLKNSISSEILSSKSSANLSTLSNFMQQLNSGDIKTVSKNVINMATTINLESSQNVIELILS